MVNLRVTHNVDSHHTNPEYQCLIVDFLWSDNNIRKRYKENIVFDWLPTDDEILRICKILFDISPTFKERLKKIINEDTIERKEKSLKEWFGHDK